MEKIDNFERSCYGGEVTKELLGKEVTLFGWVQRRRDHGGLVFIDLRDRSGVVQLVFNPEDNEALHKVAHDLRNEFVIGITGVVSERPEGTVNTELNSGEIEVNATAIKVLSKSAVPPFLIEDETDAGEDLRLKHRYLD
ncbi:MAG: aspartate--tRNA ligase, partial [Deltaproteobacteria bacterium]|nr:aspartate--tRNA ligase [Deltaproteobacteria bacterium]